MLYTEDLHAINEGRIDYYDFKGVTLTWLYVHFKNVLLEEYKQQQLTWNPQLFLNYRWSRDVFWGTVTVLGHLWLQTYKHKLGC